MKKIICVLFGLVFTLCFLFSFENLGVSFKTASASAFEKEAEEIHFELSLNEKNWKFGQSDLCNNPKILEKWGRQNGRKAILSTIDKIFSMGFNEEVAMNFMFWGLESKIEEIEKSVFVPVKDAAIHFNAGTGKFWFDNEVIGKKLDKNQLIKNLFTSLKTTGNIKQKLELTEIEPIEKAQLLSKFTYQKATFSTFCGNSSEARISNIKTAFASFNGKRIEAGEVFSFNSATGQRTERSGYQKAKIISRGTFQEGIGGGVCQASTTLYNAALRSGLEILEVNQHSLPVSYVPPSMDAMVNGGNADLVFKNNTNGPIWIRVFVKDNQFAVAEIFGCKNECTISVTSRIIKTLPKSKDEIVFDQSLAPRSLIPGEEVRISHSKDGMVSEAIIETMKNGEIIFKKKIRENRYAPTRGIIVKGI